MVLQHSCHPPLFKCVLLLQTSVPFHIGQWMKSFQFYIPPTIFSFWYIASSFHSVCCLSIPDWTIFFWVVALGFLLLIFSSNALLYILDQSWIFTWLNYCNNFSSSLINKFWFPASQNILFPFYPFLFSPQCFSKISWSWGDFSHVPLCNSPCFCIVC